MFEKTLSDVIKGIRASKRDSAKYISQCIAEIRTELTSADMFVKANALEKLTFLQMMGYSMGFASFQATEVMSSPRFAHKRIGYLAASQSFTQDTEEVILAVNLLKKELRGAVTGGSQDVYNAGLAINCLSNIVTEELARDLLPELTSLLSHPQPYLRKKAILVLFKTFVRYPDGLRLTFNKLQQSLEDANSAVVSCAVNVITELSDKNPRNYLHLAPSFFQLLSRSSNNWMLIKVVKLLGSLVPEEPRLARKLLEPLADIVKNTQAKSLLFESVYTITLCLPYSRKSDGSMPANVPSIVDLCANTLLNFVEENDQNLKYLGLVGFGSLMQSHPHVLGDPKYRPLILSCLSDEDETIRSRALELCPSITTRKNLTELVGQLMKHVESASGSYKIELGTKIIDMCSSDKYALIQDFDWYLGVLFRLGHLGGVEKLGGLLREQITSVALRVLPVRAAAVARSMEVLLEDMHGTAKNEGKQAVDPILPALAWIVGEYSSYIREAIMKLGEEFNTAYVALVRRLTDTNNASPDTEKAYIHSALKVTAAASADPLTTDEDLEACVQQLFDTLPVFTHSLNVEVAMRAVATLDLLTILGLRADGHQTIMKPETGDLLGVSGREEEKGSDVLDDTCSDAQKVRSRSSMLCYLVKSSPMKPYGSKLQKKKSKADLGDGINMMGPIESVFAALIQEEIDATKNKELSIQSISFTSQDIPTVSVAIDIKPDVTQSSHFPASSAAKTTVDDTPKRRADDPFYLDETHGQQTSIKHKNSPRFGAIQLLDSDSEGKKAKKPKKKSKKHKTTPWPQQAAMEVTVFDDEDEEDSNKRTGRSRKPGREYAGLAKVDLTAPIDNNPLPESITKTKKSKKSQKLGKRKPRQSKISKLDKPEVGDLLDLGGMIPGDSINVTQSFPVSTVGFDAFASPVAPDILDNSTTGLLPWLKVIVKDQASDVAMSMVEVNSRFRSTTRGILQTQITNNSSSALISVTMDLKASNTTIAYGTIQINEAVKREIELPIQASDYNRDLKGSIVVNGQSFALKLRVPFAISLQSERKHISLQDLAVELAMPGWLSGTVKVPLNSESAFMQTVESLKTFLSAAVVDLAVSSSTAALASLTADGGPVRFLLKMKGKYVKVDVKARQELIVDAVVNDLKRLRGL